MSLEIKFQGEYKFRSNGAIQKLLKKIRKEYVGENDILELFFDSLEIKDKSVKVKLDSQIGNNDFLDLELLITNFKSTAKKGKVKGWWTGMKENDFEIYSAGNSLLKIKGELTFASVENINTCQKKIQLLENEEELEKSGGQSFDSHVQVCGVSDEVKDSWMNSIDINALTYKVDLSIDCSDENTQYEYSEIVYVCSFFAKTGEIGIKFGNEEEDFFGPEDS